MDSTGLIGIVVVIIVGVILLLADSPSDSIICKDYNIYTQTQHNISCILCNSANEKYMDCDFDKTNRSLRGVFYR